MNCLPVLYNWYRHGVLSIRFDYWLAMMSCSPRGNQFCTLDIVNVTAKTNRLEGCAAGALRAYAVAVMRLGARDRFGGRMSAQAQAYREARRLYLPRCS